MKIVEKTTYVCAKNNKCKPCKEYSSLVWKYYNGKLDSHPIRENGDYYCLKMNSKENQLNGKAVKTYGIEGNLNPHLMFWTFRSAKNFVSSQKRLRKRRKIDDFDSSQVTLGHLVDLFGRGV